MCYFHVLNFKTENILVSLLEAMAIQIHTQCRVICKANTLVADRAIDMYVQSSFSLTSHTQSSDESRQCSQYNFASYSSTRCLIS